MRWSIYALGVWLFKGVSEAPANGPSTWGAGLLIADAAGGVPRNTTGAGGLGRGLLLGHVLPGPSRVLDAQHDDVTRLCPRHRGLDRSHFIEDGLDELA